MKKCGIVKRAALLEMTVGAMKDMPAAVELFLRGKYYLERKNDLEKFERLRKIVHRNFLKSPSIDQKVRALPGYGGFTSNVGILGDKLYVGNTPRESWKNTIRSLKYKVDRNLDIKARKKILKDISMGTLLSQKELVDLVKKRGIDTLITKITAQKLEPYYNFGAYLPKEHIMLVGELPLSSNQQKRFSLPIAAHEGILRGGGHASMLGRLINWGERVGSRFSKFNRSAGEALQRLPVLHKIGSWLLRKDANLRQFNKKLSNFEERLASVTALKSMNKIGYPPTPADIRVLNKGLASHVFSRSYDIPEYIEYFKKGGLRQDLGKLEGGKK